MDPQEQQFNQVPESPAPAPAPAPVPISDISNAGQNEMSQEQMKANLQGLMSKIDAKYQDFKSQRVSSENSVKEQKQKALQQIFDLFQSMGIDPSNIEQVGAFLEKIKQSNPELYQQIETALQGLIGEDISEQVTEGASPEQNMNINANEGVQQNI